MNCEIKNRPLWTSINDIPYTYSWLSQDTDTSVCIIGGGISGALCALRFAAAGIDVVLLSSGPVGFGVTSLSDGTLRTDVSGGLVDLSLKVGVNVATKIYERAKKSLNSIESIALSMGNKCGFSRRGTVLYTNDEDLSYDLRKEYLLRRHSGFEINILSEKNKSIDGPDVKFGIIEKNGAAVIDPFIFTHMVLSAAKKFGVRVYENTDVKEIVTNEDRPCVYTTNDKKIVTDKVIISVENSEEKFLKNIGSHKMRFYVATKPIDSLPSYRDDYMIAARLDYPEITFSMTSNNRIIAAGLSTGTIKNRVNGVIPMSMIRKNKYAHLRKELMKFFPEIKEADIEFEFFSDCLETDDGLPMIGEHELYPNCYFNICPGEDGIIFSEMASDILLGLYLGKNTELGQIFSWGKF